MSIEFDFEGSEKATRFYECDCARSATCYKCRGSGVVQIKYSVPAVRMSNSNAALVCRAMGIEMGVDDYSDSYLVRIPATWDKYHDLWRQARTLADGDASDQYVSKRIYELADLILAAIASGKPEIVGA